MEGKGAGEREAADLDLGLDIVDGVAALDLERDGLPRQRLHEDLHLAGRGSGSRARVLRRLRSVAPSCSRDRSMTTMMIGVGVFVGRRTRLFCIYTPRGFSYSRRRPARLRVGDGPMTFPIRLVEGLEASSVVGRHRRPFLAVGSDGLS